MNDYYKDPIKVNDIEIYTDGACSGNPGPAACGMIFRYNDIYKEMWEFIGHSTNNIAELKSIQLALLQIKNKTKYNIKLYTDSAYSIGVLTMGWKVKKNIELVNEIKDLICQFKNIQFIKVKGHSDNKFNARADKLATSCISKNIKK